MNDTANNQDSRVRDRSPLRSNVDRNDDDSNETKDRARERDRDRSRRSDRPSRFGPRSASRERGDRSGGGGDRSSGRKGAAERRVFVSNIAYEYRWQELKDLFRSEVGEVSYVELFTDENDKPRGCGIVEFESADSVAKAVEKMHRFDLKGRKLVVKEDFDVERDKYGRPQKRGGGGASGGGVGGGGGGGVSRMREEPRGMWDSPSSHQPTLQPLGAGTQKWGNTYGLSPQFLESLWISGPLVTRVFVANLDYKVDEKKLKEVFKLAGKVVNAELSLDKEGKSRGFGVVEFEHPVEAVQAISMLHNQVLYDRKLTVRMDRVEHKSEGPPKLPEGLRGLGMGLGSGGIPLNDVTRNLPSNQQATGGLAGAVPAVAAASLGGGLAGLSNSALSAAGLAGVGGLGTNSLMGGGGGDISGLAATLGGVGAFGGSGLGAGLGAAAAGLGGNSAGLGGGNSYGGGLGGGNSSSYLGGNSGGGYGASPSTALGPAFGGGGRDFDSLSAALGGGVGGNYGSGVGERDYRGSSTGVSSYANGPSRLSGASANASRSSDTIVIKNLPPSTTWQMLRDKCREVGDVEFAEMRGKDIGLVRFSNEWDAERAVHMMDRTRIDGRAIEVCLF